MKYIKQLTVHPELDNTVRQEVVDWCIKQWGDYHEHETDCGWWITSNYDRSFTGTFDVIFTDIKAAEFFILRWGGQVVEYEYEERFAPSQTVLDNLFY